MDQAQAKALAAIQPFVQHATAQKSPSPRFVADLISRAISAPGTYLFAELLQTPAVQSLRGTDSETWLTLLEIFSWGTLEEYKATPNLPPLDSSQIFKLRQLTLLTLASPFAPTTESTTSATNHLIYPSLLPSLSLTSTSELESLITQSIYSGLLTARLSPTSTPPAVHITSVAPLRDLRPQSLPALLQILETWESRCVAQVTTLEAQIESIRSTASQRTALQRRRQAEIDAAVLSDKVDGAAEKTVRQLRALTTGQKSGSKRDLDQQLEGDGEVGSDDEGRMDVDEGVSDIVGGSTSGIKAGGLAGGSGGGAGGTAGGGVGGSRGAKRNRGRGK